MIFKADVDSIMDMRRPEPETAPVELIEDTMLVVLSHRLLHSCLSHVVMRKGTFTTAPLTERMLVR